MTSLISIGSAPTQTIDTRRRSRAKTRPFSLRNSNRSRRHGVATLFIIFCFLTAQPGIVRGQNNPPAQGDNAQRVQEIFVLLDQSMERTREGKLEDALPLAEAALAKAQKELSPEHGIVAMCLFQTGFLGCQQETSRMKRLALLEPVFA